MNQKSLIAILVVIVVVLAGTTIYLATIKNASQPVVPAPKVSQQPANQAQPTQPTTNNRAVIENYAGWNSVKNTKYGISFYFPQKWAGSYEGPYVPEDFNINTYDNFLLSPKDETDKMCSNVNVELNPWPFRKEGTRQEDYCDPTQVGIFSNCVDKIVSFKGDTYFGKIISDYSVKEVPFENRIIESRRKGNGSYYYKHAFVNVNNTVLSFTLVGEAGAKNDKDCQEFIEAIDAMIKSASILK